MILDYIKISINKRILFACLFFLLIFNELTLSLLDKNPPLSSNTIYLIRFIDFFIVVFGLTARNIFLSFRDLLITGLIALFLLVIINFIFVYYSPQLIKILPTDVTRYTSTCYRTLYHLENKESSELNFVFGDSFSEGAGDEFLKNDPEYGIFNKLLDLNEKVLIFGRGGYGNKSTVVEFERCFPLLSSYTNLSLNSESKYNVTFVFYEGNDLNNNIAELGREYSSIKYKFRFLFPLFDYSYNKGTSLISWLMSSNFKKEKITSRNDFPKSSNGISIGVFPQAAAVELTNEQVLKSFDVLQRSLNRIKFSLPNANDYRFLYIPSVASSYEFKNILRVQSYDGKPFFKTTGEFNLKRSLYIRKNLSEISNKQDWKFCDTTPALLKITNLGFAVHGPIDWKHLNKEGYLKVADVYRRCFFDGKN
jgi:hypothetical protein